MNLINFFKHVAVLPYTNNDQGKHETTISNLLTRYKIKHRTHPNSKFRSPDILIEAPYGPINLELKSSEKAFPKWNSGLPQTDYIYIFCSKIYDGHTFFLGQDIITEQKRQLYSSLTEQLRTIVKKYQDQPN